MYEAVIFLLPPFVASVIMLALFGYLGMHVLKREIIFIDIALAQFAAGGAALAIFLGRIMGFGENETFHYILAQAATLCAAAFFALAAKYIIRLSQETVIGVSYAIAAAATLFLLGTAAGGDVHLEELLTGSILWVEWSDIILCAAIFLVIGVFHFIFRRRFIRYSEAHTDSTLPGRLLWDFLFFVSLGMVITQSEQIAGVLLTFAFLIMPAVVSALFASRWIPRLLIAWCVGIVAIVVGLTVSYRWDYSCGPAIVAILGIILGATTVIRRIVGE
jgi:zinc/manganese transport system permease protein